MIELKYHTVNISSFILFYFIFFYHLSHLGKGLPQLAYNQAETPACFQFYSFKRANIKIIANMLYFPLGSFLFWEEPQETDVVEVAYFSATCEAFVSI
jgi:hypothetical protein